ncbi:MAG: DUF2508 family protein [Firmicutes bacterium]|nr:DUF2508 family protein [Bacillota bacterium]
MTQRKLTRTHQAEFDRVLSEVRAIRENLDKAYASFEASTDPGLTEASIFEINALRAHYDHALRNIKTIAL